MLEPHVKEPGFAQGKSGELRIREVGKFTLVTDHGATMTAIPLDEVI